MKFSVVPQGRAFLAYLSFSAFLFDLLLSHLLGLPLEERQVPMDVPKRCLTQLLYWSQDPHIYVRSSVTIQKMVFWFNLVNNMQLAEALRPCSNYCVMSPDRPSVILTCDGVVPIPIKWLPQSHLTIHLAILSVCLSVCHIYSYNNYIHR